MILSEEGKAFVAKLAILNRDELLRYLSNLLKEVSEDLLKKKIKGKTVPLKVKFDDFVPVTRLRQLSAK